jgi:hypothetical protein
MTRSTSFVLRFAVAALVTSIAAAQVHAQLYQVLPMRKDPRLRTTRQPTGSSSSTNPPAVDTRITMEVFTGKEGVGYQAQGWESVFERAGLLVRIHPAFSGDKISIREKQLGKLREVFLVGKLEGNGTLVFPGRKFAKSETAAFEEWLNELKAYGAQGNPTGKALWGLRQEQFDAIFRALAAPVDEEVANHGFDEALRVLQLSDQYPFRLSTAAEKRIVETPGLKLRPARMQLRGFAHGTALAMYLSQFGLAFRPNRTPSGKLELLCVPDEEGQQPWPVGWDIPEGTYPATVAPKLFQQTQVELKDQKLADVLDAIADKTGIPVRIDFVSIEARHLDLDSVLVSASGQHLAWFQLLTRITSPSYLTAKIRTDEAKKPFVWITSMTNAPARTARPARDHKATDAGPRVGVPPSTTDQ